MSGSLYRMLARMAPKEQRELLDMLAEGNVFIIDDVKDLLAVLNTIGEQSKS